jgi:hypothetical protein
MLSLRGIALRALFVIAAVAASYWTPAADETCYMCLGQANGESVCDPDHGEGDGYTKCKPIPGGGCNPDGGAPCSRLEN